MENSNTATTKTWLLPGRVISALTAPALVVDERTEVLPSAEAYSRTVLVRQHPRYEALREGAASPPAGPLLSVDDVRLRLGT